MSPSASFLSVFFLCEMSLFPAQLSNVATAALGPAPPVEEFFQRVDEFLAQAPQQQPENAVLGKSFTALPNAESPLHSVQNQMSAYKAMKECAKCYEGAGLTFQKLDDFFRAFAKWAVHPRFLFAGAEEIEDALNDVKALCDKAGVKPRNIKPESFVTFANSLAALYKRTSPTNGRDYVHFDRFGLSIYLFTCFPLASREIQPHRAPTAPLRVRIKLSYGASLKTAPTEPLRARRGSVGAVCV